MINWWKKGFFDDLKPFDVLPLENVLERYQGALATFPEYEHQVKDGFFFLGIRSKDLSDPDVKYFHEKFNSPTCDLSIRPRKKISLVYRPGRNFSKPEYHTPEAIKFEGGTSNYNGRDGQIRGGWATPEIEEFHIKPVREGKLTGDWIYLHIPHQILYNFLDTTSNGVPLREAKKFVQEVENTVGWDDFDKVKEIEKEYDKKYPDWSHDFPINGYAQMQKEGLLFPAVWWNYQILAGHTYHRMVMTSFNKIDFPFILPVPAKLQNKWYACSRFDTFLFNNEPHYLTALIDRDNEKVTYSFTKNPDWAIEKNEELLKNE